MKKNLITCFFAILCLPLLIGCSSSSSNPTPPVNAEFDGATISEVKMSIKGRWGLIKRSDTKEGEFEEYDPYNGSVQEFITFDGNRYQKEISTDAGKTFSTNGWIKIVWTQRKVSFGTYYCFTPSGEKELIPLHIKNGELTIRINDADGGDSVYVRYDQ